MKAKRNYWISNNRGEGDCFTTTSIYDVKKIITNEMNHILQEDGRVSGGYSIDKKNGQSIVSNGEFRLINGKAVYFADYTEIQ